MRRSAGLLLPLVCAAACTCFALADETPDLPTENIEQPPALTESQPAAPENETENGSAPAENDEKDDIPAAEPPEESTDAPDLDSGFLIEPEPEPEPTPEPEIIVLTRFDTQTNFDLTAVACGDEDALRAFFRDTRDGLCGYDALGTPYDFSTGEWDLSAVDLTTPGVYDATAPLLLVDDEERACFSLAEGVDAPVIHCRVSVQQAGKPEIGEFITARGQMIFPWVLTEEQAQQLDRFTVYLKPENGEWTPLVKGISVQKDALTLYPRTCGLENGTVYALQVDYPDGHTGILTFVSDTEALKLGYSEGNRDGGGEDTRLPDIIQPAPSTSHSGGSHRQPTPAEPDEPSEPETPPTETPDTPSEPTEEPENTEQPAPTAPVLERDTADGAVLSGTRLRALIELDEPLTLNKNGVAFSLPPDALRALEPTDTDTLSVTLRRTEDGGAQAELAKNGEAIDPPDGMTLTTEDTEPASPMQKRRSPLPFAAAGAAVLAAVFGLLGWRKRL